MTQWIVPEGTYHLSIESAKYRKVWYLLHTCPNVEKWPSVLLLCELVFSLPFSNGRVEQIFSSLKVSKTSNRTSLQTSTLDDLLEISIEEPPLSSLSADCAIDLWRSDCRNKPDKEEAISTKVIDSNCDLTDQNYRWRESRTR